MNTPTDTPVEVKSGEGAFPVATPESGSGDDLFAKAVGMTTSPAGRPSGRRRFGRRARNSGRPLVTAEDAARMTTTVPVTDQPWTPATDAGSPAATEPGAQPLASGPIPVVGVTPAAQAQDQRSWWQRRRMKARRVRRTIRHIDPWSVLKLSIFMYLILYVAAMAAGVLLWNAAIGSGLVDQIESFIVDVGAFETFKFNGQEIFDGAKVIGLVLVVAGTALNVIMTIVFNLISDLIGGVRVTVLEEDLGRPARS